MDNSLFIVALNIKGGDQFYIYVLAHGHEYLQLEQLLFTDIPTS
jgi:hypothetical protein